MAVRQRCTERNCKSGRRCLEHVRFDVAWRGHRYRMPVNDFAIPRMEPGKQRPIQSMEEARDWERLFIGEIKAGRDPRRGPRRRPRPRRPRPGPCDQANGRRSSTCCIAIASWISPQPRCTTLLEEHTYLCSPRTMYRILADAGEVRERRDQARHPAYVKPELVATSPNQLWSWDITKLKGRWRISTSRST